MEGFYFFIYLISGLLTIVIIIKFFKLCGHIKDIHEILSKQAAPTPIQTVDTSRDGEYVYTDIEGGKHTLVMSDGTYAMKSQVKNTSEYLTDERGRYYTQDGRNFFEPVGGVPHEYVCYGKAITTLNVTYTNNSVNVRTSDKA